MSYDIERYLSVRSAGGASLSPSGRLSFLIDTTGVPQVWTLDSPGAWPEQRTFEDERVSFATWSPTREELVFGMDEGGNERVQLFRLAGDGSEVVPLTATPAAKHGWGGWSRDGDRIAFTSNRRDEAVFDVYVQGRDESGDDATMLLSGDDMGWLGVSGWSPDDARLAVTEAHSNQDLDVHVLDVDPDADSEDPPLTHLTPHDGEVRFSSVNWGPDGDALYCVTDQGEDEDTLRLVRLDAETGAMETVVDGGEWNVNGVAVDVDTGRAVYSRNVDGYGELTPGVLDGAAFEPFPAPDLPAGVAGGVSFGPDAERFAISATGPRHNGDVYVVETATGAAERWTRASTAGIPRESFAAPELVRYEAEDGLEIPAFLWLPEAGDANVDSYPAVVDFHGGPESQHRPTFDPVAQYLLANGYAVFQPNVRGSTGYGKAYMGLDDVEGRMDAVADGAAGVRWLRENAPVDPDRIAAMGGSYGGFVVLASLTEYPDLWAGGVDVVGIANFVTFLENTGEWRRPYREAEYGSLADDRAFLESISPITSIDRIRAPLLVLHGANDPRVPVGEAEQIAERAAEHVPVDSVIFEDEGHGFSKLENRVTAYRRVVDFLDEHV